MWKHWDMQIENETLKAFVPPTYEDPPGAYSLAFEKTETGYTVKCLKNSEPKEILVWQSVYTPRRGFN
jgi:hypothetical protein